MASFFAPQSSFYLFQAANHRNKMPLEAYLDALREARRADLDIVNISAGRFRKNCDGGCHFCQAALRLIKSGTKVVAAAGNRDPEESRDSIHCPGQREKAITVGGSLDLCEGDISVQNRIGTKGQVSPPGSYTGKNLSSQNFCGGRGCSPFDSCENNRKTIFWSGNVVPSVGKPDVLAPVNIPSGIDKENEMPFSNGSSFSTAIVSGGLANILSSLERDVSPFHIKKAMDSAQTTIDDEFPIFDGKAIYRSLH